MHRKKRLRLASAKRGTLKTGWYGIGRPLIASMPSTAASAAERIVVSNVTGMNAGQLLSGRPPTLMGYATTEAQYLEREPADAADDAADQHNQRQPRRLLPERFGELLDRERCERIHAPVAGFVCVAGRSDQSGRGVELGHQAVDWRAAWRCHHITRRSSSLTSASGSIVRISKIEIMGRKRMKRNNSVTKSPMEPIKVAQSQIVG